VQSVAAVVGGKRYPLEKIGEDELYSRYRARVPWDRKTDLTYAFELTDGAKKFQYGANGLTTGATAAKPFTLKASEYKPFAVPQWVEQTAFYQIFPDRFENGDKTNDPKKTEPWNGSPAWFNRFGGDIAGVEKHVDHLDTLGIGAVYFNPVFASPSNHRYDAQDFKKIDPEFGTNEEFARLSKALDKRGIKTVMDFVFNHSATNFFAFQDIQDKGPASTYKDWYFVKSYPVKIGENPNYEAWFGFASMPKLNVMNPPTHDYLLGLVDYWKAKIPLAGMRLDVANEVDQRFWRDLRVKAKTLDPNLWIVGEVWGDGSPWLQGDQWDSVMNYQFRDACLRFFAEEKTTPTQFANRLMALDASYAPQVSRNMMNLLSSHDTPRFLTLCKNDASMHKLAATLQFTWVGAPSIYYGEEIGMEGGADPDNRRGMEWQKATETNPMLNHYKTLIATRNKSRALQSGDPTILLTDDQNGTFAFARSLDKDVAVVALNRSREPRTVTLSLAKAPAAVRDALRTKGFTDALTGKRTAKSSGDLVTLTLAPLTGAVLVP
jgi:glycosidase